MIVYIASATLFYLFLWLLHISTSHIKEVDPVLLWVVDGWLGRLVAAALWPVLLAYVGMKLYEDRKDED